MSTTPLFAVPDQGTPPTWPTWRHRLASPWTVACLAYCAGVAIAGAWWAILVGAAELGCALLCGRAWRRHRLHRPHPAHSVAGSILGGAVLLRNGVIASLGGILVAVALCALVVLGWVAGLFALLAAGHGYPALLAIVAGTVAAVAPRVQRSGHTTPPPVTGPTFPGSPPDAGEGAPWRPFVEAGHTEPGRGPTAHYRRQILRTNRLREEEAAQVYALGRTHGAASSWRRRVGKREASYGAGYAEGWAAGREAHRQEVWADDA